MALAELDIELGRIAVHTEWAEKDLIKQVPGMRWDSRARVWHGPLSWGTCVVLRGVLRDKLTLGPQLRQWATSERKFIDHALALRDKLGLTDDERSLEAEVIRSWRDPLEDETSRGDTT